MWGHITSSKLCQVVFVEKLVNTVFEVNILSAKIKALKIVDIWFILLMIDDQKHFIVFV